MTQPIALPIKVRPKEGWRSLSQEGVPTMLAKLFAARGVTSSQMVKVQGKPLLSWKKMKGIDRGVERLMQAIERQEKIVIVADYDSDGATSCAIGLLALRAFGAQVEFKVPNRFIHGYGLTISVVDEVFEEFKPDVIMTVDNGISSIDGVDRANELNMDVIVTDHHLPIGNGGVPNAYTIINPNQEGCEFPSKNLAGCGVVYYLMAALREALSRANALPDNAPPISSWLDLVAVGTIADVVKLDENNRLLARLGLDRIRYGNAHPGVAALFTVAKRATGRATSTDIGFAIGPRINAAGRLDDMAIGIKCLIESKFEDALELALQLDDLNQARKEIEKSMQSEADILVWQGQDRYVSSICVKNDEFHEGVIGIVAGKIKEREHRPTLVFAKGQEEGLLKGSGRSIPGFHLRDALDRVYKKIPEAIVKFGGHAMAAGITIKEKCFEVFQSEFDAVCQELLTEDILERFILVDGHLEAEEACVNNIEQMQQEVWGNMFEEPLFSWRVKIKSQKLLKNEHLKLEVEKDGLIFDAIWFFNNQLLPSEEAEIVFGLSVNEFRSNQTVQLQIKQASAVYDEGLMS